jgi:hypothetical protein
MRRRFNPDLLPKHPPAKYDNLFKTNPKQRNVGSPFNQWFKKQLDLHGLTMKQFCRLSGVNYGTARGWRYQTDPQCDGRVRVAKTFAKLQGIEYREMYKIVCKLCKKWC